MPIEIREFHFKAVIDGAGGNDTSQEGGSSANGESAAALPNTDQLVDLCVEKIMEILREKTER